jgi:outer membrane immunogenic protein
MPTGGVAVGNVKGNFNFSDTFAAATESGSISTTRTGWAAGGGMEVGVAGPWTVKVEYLHVDLGSASTTSTNLRAFTPSIAFPQNPFTHSVDLTANILRVGVNYRF